MGLFISARNAMTKAAHSPSLASRRQVGIPDVEPVIGRMPFLADAARWAGHGSNPHTFFRQAKIAEADDLDAHDDPVPAMASEVRRRA